MLMTKQDIPKTYNAKEIEDSIYKKWEESGYFNPDNLNIPKNAETFTISMPPPNATGELHLGHAEFLTLQDLMIRFERLRGKQALYLPGTDHAAIATQNKVEKILKKERGVTREELGREKFLQEVAIFVKSSQDTIKKQIRKMGTSCDWSREKYTLEPALTKAVQETFVRMYNDGLIYRGDRIVNWCPRCASTLADDEVEYKPEKTKFYYMKYGPITIGTARPETKFLDKTIVVHPSDERYKDIVGKTFMVPWINGEVEANVIADKAAQMEFGTGAMTITPAHSFLDFDIAKRHNLPVLQIINEQGILTDNAGEFAGKIASEARDELIAKMKEKGLIEKIDENYEHQISVCYRCGHVVEPLISKQWFIDVGKPAVSWKGKTVSIKQASIDAVKSGDIEIIPDQFNKTYFHWMKNLRDWCISRQIWFGHRIPVWYHETCQNIEKIGEEKPIVSIEEPRTCPHCEHKDGSAKIFRQDPDVLDTWFSSGLWTFSTLGWPKETEDLKKFHPTSVLETGYDILFFWVARMIIMATYCVGEIPFEKVYLHGLVRDKQGRKMSKSLGNGIDPLKMIEKYGTDAVRLSLVIGTTPGNDVRLYEEKIAGYRNFVNKLWNISRFILMNIDETTRQSTGHRHAPTADTLADKWILKKFTELCESTAKDCKTFNFSRAGENLRAFTWNSLADWYLEIAKIEGGKDEILLYILKNLLKLWHPFTPFVTEHIYSMISDKLLMADGWAETHENYEKFDTKDFDALQTIITVIRNSRALNKVNSGDEIDIVIKTEKPKNIISAQKNIIEKLARVKITDADPNETDYTNASVPEIDIYLKTKKEQDPKKLKKEIQNAKEYIQSLKQMLANKSFTENAPAQVVQEKKNKLKQAEETLKKLCG